MDLSNTWQFGKTREGEEISWNPICTLEFNPDNKRVIGLSENGIWVTAFEPLGTSYLSLINNRQDCFWIMAILDKDRVEVENLIRNGLEFKNLSLKYLTTFPFKELIKFCLANDTGHWGIKATTWLKQEEFDDELSSIVDNIIVRKLLDQGSRHYLFTMKKRYDRA